jgi:serine/threonine protein kinase
MARAKKRELLPVGKSISHDNSQLKIEKKLKAGLTGEVYEGYLTGDKESSVHVAVKAMKTLEFPAARQFFLQESETLAFLMHLEEEANREQGLDLKIAPVYYGRGEYEENPYLVMEFIEGKEIPGLLKDAEDGKFSEKQAVMSAWHLYRTLDILHRLLKKTYIDLKFENLWWVEPNVHVESGQLKLTDFGTMENIQPGNMQQRGIARDLLLAAVYFCKMATGYVPNYSFGELKELGELKKQIQNKENKVSWGTRRELKRLLHRNPDQRPAEASDVAARLRILVDFWSRDVEKVLEIARKSLERAQTAYDEASEQNKPMSEEGLNFAYRVRAAFDIVSLRSPDLDISLDKERLESILKSAGHLERGKDQLRGRDYSPAKKTFQEGMEWEDDPAPLRRWAYLSEVGEEISPSAFESIQDRAFVILNDLFTAQLWNDAIEELTKIQASLEALQGGKKSPDGLNYLLSEARLFAEIAKADAARDREDFESAAKSYRNANLYLEELPVEPYQKFIRENELGDLETAAREMEANVAQLQQQADVDAKFDLAVESVNVGDENARDLTMQAYRAALALSYKLERLREVTRAALTRKDSICVAGRLERNAGPQSSPPVFIYSRACSI